VNIHRGLKKLSALVDKDAARPPTASNSAEHQDMYRFKSLT